MIGEHVNSLSSKHSPHTIHKPDLYENNIIIINITILRNGWTLVRWY